MSTTIFVIDDDVMISELLKSVLKDIPGIKVISFISGEDALLNLDLNPKIIILDYFLNSININAMDGLSVLREIKRSLPLSKVIIVSGQEDLEVVYKLNQYQADDYVVKDNKAVLQVKRIVENMLEKN
jgi:DNA-binding NarL/FixJ family response regulator